MCREIVKRENILLPIGRRRPTITLSIVSAGDGFDDLLRRVPLVGNQRADRPDAVVPVARYRSRTGSASGSAREVPGCRREE